MDNAEKHLSFTNKISEWGYDTKITIVRVILVLLVIIGHGIFYTIDTNFGGLYIYEVMERASIKDTWFHGFLLYVSSFIYSFHMPAFFSVFVMLFYRSQNKGKYADIKSLVKHKFSRLIIPLIFAWMVINIPIKWLFGYYENLKHPVWSVILQIAVPYDFYLWFLEVLFVVFVLTWLINKFCGELGIKEYIISIPLLILGIGAQKVLGK